MTSRIESRKEKHSGPNGLSEMEKEENSIYAVVLFLPKKDSNNLVDLVPVTWIVRDKTGKINCKYPEAADYAKLPAWVASLQPPLSDWPSFPIEIVSYARNFKQGKRRLKRAFTTTETKSTDGDDVAPSSMPVILNTTDLEKELNDMELMVLPEVAETDKSNNEKVSSPQILFVDVDNENICANNCFNADVTKQYIDDKFQEVKSLINSTKRSILYDIEKKINEIKCAMSCQSTEVTNDITNVGDIGMALPIQTIGDFLKFEETIASSEDKKKALLNWNRTLIFGETSLNKCVKRIMSSTLTKAVEKEYSAFGRQMNSVGKKDFSKTQTYVCLNVILQEKFGRTEDYKKLSTIISRWLSGASDREGGRKKRNCFAE